jgi:hypothetical protein
MNMCILYYRIVLCCAAHITQEFTQWFVTSTSARALYFALTLSFVKHCYKNYDVKLSRQEKRQYNFSDN